MCVSGPPKCKRGHHLSKMLQEEFINAGLNFIDPEAYRVITEDEEKAEARAIEDASSQRAKDEAGSSLRQEISLARGQRRRSAT